MRGKRNVSQIDLKKLLDSDTKLNTSKKNKTKKTDTTEGGKVSDANLNTDQKKQSKEKSILKYFPAGRWFAQEASLEAW